MKKTDPAFKVSTVYCESQTVSRSPLGSGISGSQGEEQGQRELLGAGCGGGEWKMAPRFRLPSWRVVPFTGTGAQQEQRLGKKINSVWDPLRLTAMLVGHQVEVTK